jgi:GNAT superfamily N-acetyltransferase
MRIVGLEPGSHIDTLYHDILQPAFPPAELCSLDDLRQMITSGHPTLVALDDDDTVIGGAVGEWEPELRVILLSWLAVRPGLRSGGVGGMLLDVALDAWPEEFDPCLILAEVEDPSAHLGSEATGDPSARLRFYQRHGARALEMPYFQASLGPGLDRVPGLFLMVLHAHIQFLGQRPDSIATGILRTYLENYQRQCEGHVGTDEQAMQVWRALDAHPDGVPWSAGSCGTSHAPV